MREEDLVQGDDVKAGHHSSQSIAFDPMASLMEEYVRPRMLSMRRAALRVWHVTLDRWVIEEESLGGHDTERLERLIDLAWKACKEEIGGWDSRFALQSLRSLPPEAIDWTIQLGDDPDRLAGIVIIATAAAATSNGIRWPKSQLTPEQLEIVMQQAPDVLGGCLGTAHLVFQAQGWYRWAGKGKRLQSMPFRIGPEHLSAIDQLDGSALFLVNAPSLSENATIERSVTIYESRRDSVMSGWRQSGLLSQNGEQAEERSSARMWYVNWRGTHAARPVHVPALNLTFPAPAWYPLPDFHLAAWIELLRPFDDALQSRLKLSCDELLTGLTALGLVIERQTQCGYLRVGERKGTTAIFLESPAEGQLLLDAVRHLASVLLRGTLRASVDAFVTAIQSELEMLRWPQPRKLAEALLNALKGLPEPRRFPSPILFYELDALTCVLDLSLWKSFPDACLAIATSGGGDVGSQRGRLFEEQARQQLIAALQLSESDIPWPANRDVWEGLNNLGDVDFCFSREGVLVNLDMKSWQHSSDYFAGHYHTINQRMRSLKEHIERLELRGIALQHQLERKGLNFADRLDFLIVAFPEYLPIDQQHLWYRGQPRVITVNELVLLASEPGLLQRLRQSNLRREE